MIRGILVVLLFFAIIGCGGEDVRRTTGGGEPIETPLIPIDGTPDSLNGTYKITLLNKTKNGVTNIYSGDNVTGEIVLSIQKVQWRYEYNDDNYSYYTHNLDERQDLVENQKIFDSLRLGVDGYEIKSETQINLQGIEVTKISNYAKNLKDTPTGAPGYNKPYKKYDKTPISPSKENMGGTYSILEARDSRGRTFKEDIGEVSFIDNNTLYNNLCEGLFYYQLYNNWKNEPTINIFPYDKTVAKPCEINRIDSFEIQLIVGNAGPLPPTTQVTYRLLKSYDALRF